MYRYQQVRNLSIEKNKPKIVRYRFTLEKKAQDTNRNPVLVTTPQLDTDGWSKYNKHKVFGQIVGILWNSEGEQKSIYSKTIIPLKISRGYSERMNDVTCGGIWQHSRKNAAKGFHPFLFNCNVFHWFITTLQEHNNWEVDHVWWNF